MRTKTKIIIGIVSSVIVLILFLAFCSFLSYRDSKLSEAHTYEAEQLLYYAHKPEEAMRELEKALELSPRNTHAEAFLLDLYFDHKRYQDIIGMQLRQLENVPDAIWDFKRNKRLGEAYLAIGDLAKAEEIYQNFYKEYSDSPSGPFGLSAVYEKKGELQKAVEYQEKGILLMKKDYRFTPKTALDKETQRLNELLKKN